MARQSPYLLPIQTVSCFVIKEEHVSIARIKTPGCIREGKGKIVFVALADISETNRVNKGGRGRNKKRCKFSERN